MGAPKGAGTGVAGCGSATPALAEVWRGVARNALLATKKKKKKRKKKEKKEKERKKGEKEREREGCGDWGICDTRCGGKNPLFGQGCGEVVPLRARVWQRRAP